MTKTFDLIVSVWHVDGTNMAHRACFSTQENRDECGRMVLTNFSEGKDIVIGPDAQKGHDALCLDREDIRALHLRIENPPKPPVAVAFEGKDYVPVEDASGARVLWPAAWFPGATKAEPAAVAVN